MSSENAVYFVVMDRTSSDNDKAVTLWRTRKLAETKKRQIVLQILKKHLVSSLVGGTHVDADDIRSQSIFTSFGCKIEKIEIGSNNIIGGRGKDLLRVQSLLTEEEQANYAEGSEGYNKVNTVAHDFITTAEQEYVDHLITRLGDEEYFVFVRETRVQDHKVPLPGQKWNCRKCGFHNTESLKCRICDSDA